MNLFKSKHIDTEMIKNIIKEGFKFANLKNFIVYYSGKGFTWNINEIQSYFDSQITKTKVILNNHQFEQKNNLVGIIKDLLKSNTIKFENWTFGIKNEGEWRNESKEVQYESIISAQNYDSCIEFNDINIKHLIIYDCSINDITFLKHILFDLKLSKYLDLITIEKN